MFAKNSMFRNRHTALAPRNNRAAKIKVERVNFWYGDKQALRDVDLDIPDRAVTAFIGASGCGKTTLLKCLNRMHDQERAVRMTGRILLDGVDIYGPEIDPPTIRRRLGWVAQKPDPFPWTVYENLAYAPRLSGMATTSRAMDANVERQLRRVGLWDELRDRLDDAGIDLSIGQQQRLCIARALAVEPDVLLMDEPTGSLDPIATKQIEDLILEMKRRIAIVLITHNMARAARVSDLTAFFQLGRILEAGPTAALFTAPKTRTLQDYLAGRFG